MIMDKYFRVNVLNQTNYPQCLIYAAMHQDYSEQYVFDEMNWFSSTETALHYPPKVTEEQAGEIAVKRLLAGNRGHFGCIEHPQIVFSVGYFPHSTMQQVRTHRIGCSFDVQSFRYTGQRIVEVAEGKRDVEEVFYLRPAGEFYPDRSGGKFFYDIDMRYNDLQVIEMCVRNYAFNISKGMPEEQARAIIPFDVRQHWVMSFNLRSLMHLLDLRYKQDAQLECQQLCELIYPHFEKWVPQIADWYSKNRLHKARLAP